MKASMVNCVKSLFLSAIIAIFCGECRGIITELGAITLTSPTQSSTQGSHSAAKALDGNTNGASDEGSCMHTTSDSPAWWKANIEGRKCVGRVVIWNRISTDGVNHRLDNAMIKVGDDVNGLLNPVCNTVTSAQVDAGQKIELSCEMLGKYLTIQLPGTQWLHVCEVQAYEGVCLGQDEIRLQSTSQSSTYNSRTSDLGVDGRTNGGAFTKSGHTNTCFHTLGGSVCTDTQAQPLGMESGVINNNQITASETHFSREVWQARLNNAGYWAATTAVADAVSDPWVQVDFNQVRYVTGVITQGCGCGGNGWTKTINIQYGDSVDSLTYISDNGSPMSFTANSDETTEKNIALPQPIKSRVLRITAISCNFWCALRLEAIGCVEANPGEWWKADMGDQKCVGKVLIWNRVDCCKTRLIDAMLKVGDNPDGTLNPVCDKVITDQVDAGMVVELHCEMKGRYLTLQLPEAGERINACEVKAYEGSCLGHEWHMVFRAVTGVPNPDPYALWISSSSHNDYVPEARELTNEFKGHYKSMVARRWSELDISEVKVSLYKDGSAVKELTFDGSGTDSTNWFTKSRLIASSWSDLASSSATNYFSYDGYAGTTSLRRFYISKSHGGCGVDSGWMVMMSQTDTCSWGRPSGVDLPIFMYSSQATAATWNDGGIGIADIFVIFIKVPRRQRQISAPGIMFSNHRLNAASLTTIQGLSFAKCNTECQLNSACKSFNHRTESLTCELNSVELSDVALTADNGWSFYPVAKNSRGKCDNNPCENSGFCKQSSDIFGYRCLCQSSYHGHACQYKRD